MRRTSTAFLVALGLVLAGVTPAHAKEPPSKPAGGSSIGSTITAKPPTTGLAPGQTLATIVCEIQANYPHKSTHIPGTINATSTITCSAPVASLDIDMYLWEDGELAGDGSNGNQAHDYIQANAYSGCFSGDYFASANGYVVFPAGYSPPSAALFHASPSIHISCP